MEGDIQNPEEKSEPVLQFGFRKKPSFRSHLYAALDLGTNNCRLLVAHPNWQNFRIIDSFSRIVRLGEDLTFTQVLSEAAMERTISALRVCASKLSSHSIHRARLVATQACRSAQNGSDFIARIYEETGLRLEIIDQATEAYLATSSCLSLVDPRAQNALLFDIGGGSSEIVWLSRTAENGPIVRALGQIASMRMKSWVSLPLGVITLAEKFKTKEGVDTSFEEMVDYVLNLLATLPEISDMQAEKVDPMFHLLGTSGTVTTLSGIYLGLPRYERRYVDGLWMHAEDMRHAVHTLCTMSYHDRLHHGCIGIERAELVMAGTAIFEAIFRLFPADRIRVADRGLREGILMQLMAEDQIIGK